MAAQAPRREPTIRELEAAITKVANTVAEMNQRAVEEAKWFRETFIAHREEVRKGFAETATRTEMRNGFAELGTALGGQIAEMRRDVTDIAGRLERLETFLRSKFNGGGADA
jgi:hypothetical protein